MRSIWNGAISFGLVTIPVGLYPATENKRPKFRQLRESDHSRIKYKRTAESDGEEVPFENIVKGYEFEKGRYVVFTSEELSDVMKGISGGTVTVNSFVDATEIDAIYYKTSYYLAPEETGIKAYNILRDALKDKGVVGLATVAIRERGYLATLRAEDDVMILETMFWPDEVREPAFESLQTEVEVTDAEVEMAGMIIDNLTATFDPSAWHDESREAVEVAAQAKIDGKEIVSPESPEPTAVVDLMDALKASVDATKRKTA